jgi:hypothetical protein
LSDSVILSIRLLSGWIDRLLSEAIVAAPSLVISFHSLSW